MPALRLSRHLPRKSMSMSGLAIAATEAAVSTVVAIRESFLLLDTPGIFKSQILNPYGKPAEDRLVPENRQMNEN
jgi:hypothetical protein